ncbi:MAG: winged helix-turn-helix transcriptional regulator, partial [Promethearchaeia archaeon]
MKEKRKKITIIFFFFILFKYFLIIPYVYSLEKDIYGFSIQDKVDPGESISYNFLNNLHFKIKSNVSLHISIAYNPIMSNRQVEINVRNNQSLQLNISSNPELSSFGIGIIPKNPKEARQMVYNYGCIYRIWSNSSIEEISFMFLINKEFGLNEDMNYSLVFYKLNEESWCLIDTEKTESNDETYLQGKLQNLEERTYYFVSIFEVEQGEEPSNNWFWIILIIILIIVLISITIIISKSDFFDKIRQRNISIDKGVHQLSIEEVLENENRNKIINLILDEPGIHFNELLRKTQLSPGNLVWHLEILERYKIISKKIIGKFLAYFPYYNQNPISNLDLSLSKSKVT